jgi:hypothetical protein
MPKLSAGARGREEDVLPEPAYRFRRETVMICYKLLPEYIVCMKLVRVIKICLKVPIVKSANMSIYLTQFQFRLVSRKGMF